MLTAGRMGSDEHVWYRCTASQTHTHTHTHPTAQEAGFKDFKTLRSDPDLRVLREQDGEVRTPSHTRAGQQARVSSFDVL